MKTVRIAVVGIALSGLVACTAPSIVNGSPEGSPGSSAGSTSNGNTPIASVRSCEQAHRMSRSTEHSKMNQDGLIHFRYQNCSPGSVGASSDGYLRIDDYETGTGAGDDADDTDVYNFITGPCTGYRITYGYIGLKKTFPAVNLHQGTITQIDHPTRPYTYNTARFHIATPGQGQAVLVDNGDAQFKTLTCTGRATTAAEVPRAVAHPAIPSASPTSPSNTDGLTPPVGFTSVDTFTASASGTSTKFVLTTSQAALTWRCVTGQIQQFGVTVTEVGHDPGYSDPGDDDFGTVSGVYYFYPDPEVSGATSDYFLNVTLEGSATCYVMVSQQG